jgi:hypothetical protein
MKREQLWLRPAPAGSGHIHKTTFKSQARPHSKPGKRATLSPALPHSKTYGH